VVEQHPTPPGLALTPDAVPFRRPRWRLLARLIRAAVQQPLGAFFFLVIALIAIAALFAEVVATHDPILPAVRYSLAPPGTVARDGSVFLLGTDPLGRDVYSRLIFGARISLAVGVAAVTIGTVGGLLLGMFSGYRGGRIDSVIQRLMDSVQAIPVLLLAIMLVAVLGTSIVITAVVIGVTQIPRANRVVRGNVLSVMQEPYVEAARAMGASGGRMLLQHIMPNVMASTIIVFSTSIGGAIVTEATLSFLGLAAAPPLATWGGMISLEGRQYMLHAPWLLIAPAAALSVAVLAFNFVGDAVRDMLDPRLRGR